MCIFLIYSQRNLNKALLNFNATNSTGAVSEGIARQKAADRQEKPEQGDDGMWDSY